MSGAVTTAALVELVQPFAGARLSREPRTAGIHILHTGHSRDASVRAADDEGVTLHWDGMDEVVPWSAVEAVTVFAIDADGAWSGQVEYRHAGPAAATRRAA